MVSAVGDPKEGNRGPINSIEPVLGVPSHHGPDVQTVISNLNIQTMAVKVPTTIMHVHCIIAELKKEPNVEKIIELWEETPRVDLIDGYLMNDDSKISNLPKNTAEIMELARDSLYTRGDLNQTQYGEMEHMLFEISCIIIKQYTRSLMLSQRILMLLEQCVVSKKII